jgi:hypothetical protein
MIFSQVNKFPPPSTKQLAFPWGLYKMIILLLELEGVGWEGTGKYNNLEIFHYDALH